MPRLLYPVILLVLALAAALPSPAAANDSSQLLLDPAYRSGRNGSPAPTHWTGPIMGQNRDYPLALDWRDNNGNWITRIRNQGGCGSCWVFSAVAATETWLMQHEGAPNPGLNLSEQYVLSCVSAGSCDGGWCQNALAFMTTEGTCDEYCFPYLGDDTVPCEEACDDVLERLIYLGDYRQITHGTIDVDAINTALQDGPLVTNYAIYEDFYGYTDGIYIYDGVSAPDGGHSVLIVGYDHGRQAWLVKNSWGEDFGELGYFWIGYDSGTGFGSETWQARDANQRPHLSAAECAPDVAPPGATLSWSVTYQDPDGDQPLSAVLELTDPGGRLTTHHLNGEGDVVTGLRLTVELSLDSPGLYGTSFRVINDHGQTVTWPLNGVADMPRIETANSAPMAARSAVLHAPSPNPANPGCTIRFELDTPQNVQLAVYDLKGRRQAVLVDGHRSAGSHHFTWHGRDEDGRELASGTYLVRLQSPTVMTTRKIKIVR